MADDWFHHLSLDIQTEILKKLPVKSLIRFRSVSKAWRSLIDSSKFITDHSFNNRTGPNRLLLRYVDETKGSDFEYVSIIDDDDYDSLSQKEVIHTDTIPMYDDILVDKPYSIIGISQGLFCFYNFYESTTSVIWNPSIRKSVAIKMPNNNNNNNNNNMLYRPMEPAIGFGVCPRTSDPKLIWITSFQNWKVEVFTLSSGTWRSSISSCNWPPERVIVINSKQVDLDGFIYWYAWEIVYVDDDDDVGGKKKLLNNCIISFDLTTEEFKQVYLPRKLLAPNFLTNPAINVTISKLRDSLVVVENTLVVGEQVYGVWMIKQHGGGSVSSSSFTKLFTIGLGLPDACIESMLGFRKNGRPILEVKSIIYGNGNGNGNGYGNVINNLSDMVTYEHTNNSKQHISHLGIIMYGKRVISFVSSYVETLLLLDHH